MPNIFIVSLDQYILFHRFSFFSLSNAMLDNSHSDKFGFSPEMKTC